MVSRVRRKYPICNCVHSYSFSPCQTPFKNMSFAMITKPWMATELTKTLHTGALCPLLCPGTRSRPGTRAPGHRAQILAWVCLRKECVHISVQRVQYSGTKCEGFLTFPRVTKERGHVCTQAVCSINVEFTDFRF